MIKTISTAIIASFLLAPGLTFAAERTPIELQIAHLSAIAAALQAQAAALQGESLACSMVASKHEVNVNESFALAWGSIGTVQQSDASKQMDPNGFLFIALDRPGIWTYKFTFYGANDTMTTCSTKIVAH